LASQIFTIDKLVNEIKTIDSSEPNHSSQNRRHRG